MLDNVDKIQKELSNGIGKEVGRSLAELVTALLKPGAVELGGLIGDSIGIVSDQIKRKRAANAAAAMLEVKQKLDNADVELEKLAPTSEEELYLLINGASLADDPSVRNLWSGLFAQSLDPNSPISAERPFIRVLESLTPLDARLIDFLAFAEQTEQSLNQTIADHAPKGLDYNSAEGKDTLARFQIFRKEATEGAISEIEKKAVQHGLCGPMQPGWVDNLFRQGVVQNPPIKLPHDRLRIQSLEQRDLVAALHNLHEQLEAMKRVSALDRSQPQEVFSKQVYSSQLRLHVCFTEFGRRLASACGLF